MKRWLEHAGKVLLTPFPKPNKGEEHHHYLARKEQEDERLELARIWLHEYAVYATSHPKLPPGLLKVASALTAYVDTRQAEKTAAPPVERTGRKRAVREVVEA